MDRLDFINEGIPLMTEVYVLAECISHETDNLSDCSLKARSLINILYEKAEKQMELVKQFLE